jgi:PAS domain-containing protein
MPVANFLASVDPARWPRLALQALGAQAALLVRGHTEAGEGAPELYRTLRGVLRLAVAAGAEQAADGCLAAPLRNARGTVVGALGVAATGRAWTPEDAALLRDLASGASAEGVAVEAVEAVRDSEERFRAIFARAAIGVLVVDMGGRILQTNLAFRRMVRLSARELRRMYFYELNHPDDNAANLPLFRDREPHRLHGRAHHPRHHAPRAPPTPRASSWGAAFPGRTRSASTPSPTTPSTTTPVPGPSRAGTCAPTERRCRAW